MTNTQHRKLERQVNESFFVFLFKHNVDYFAISISALLWWWNAQAVAKWLVDAFVLFWFQDLLDSSLEGARHSTDPSWTILLFYISAHPQQALLCSHIIRECQFFRTFYFLAFVNTDNDAVLNKCRKTTSTRFFLLSLCLNGAKALSRMFESLLSFHVRVCLIEYVP